MNNPIDFNLCKKLRSLPVILSHRSDNSSHKQLLFRRRALVGVWTVTTNTNALHGYVIQVIDFGQFISDKILTCARKFS